MDAKLTTPSEIAKLEKLIAIQNMIVQNRNRATSIREDIRREDAKRQMGFLFVSRNTMIERFNQRQVIGRRLSAYYLKQLCKVISEAYNFITPQLKKAA